MTIEVARLNLNRQCLRGFVVGDRCKHCILNLALSFYCYHTSFHKSMMSQHSYWKCTKIKCGVLYIWVLWLYLKGIKLGNNKTSWSIKSIEIHLKWVESKSHIMGMKVQSSYIKTKMRSAIIWGNMFSGLPCFHVETLILSKHQLYFSSYFWRDIFHSHIIIYWSVK